LVLLQGEGDDVDPSDPEIQAAIQEVRAAIKGVPVENLYNMDETGVFFRQMPNRTYVTRSEVTAGKLYLKHL